MAAKNFDHTNPNHLKGPTHSGVYIKPSHRGLLHEKLGVPKGDKIPAEKIEKALHSKSPALRKEANFARNFGHKKG